MVQNGDYTELSKAAKVEMLGLQAKRQEKWR